MKFDTLSDQAIAAEMGRRLEQLRLERNLTQQQLADEIGLSRVSYRKLVDGEGKLVNFIALIRALGRVAGLEAVIPDTVFSPMEQIKLKGKTRKRASRRRDGDAESNDDLDW